MSVFISGANGFLAQYIIDGLLKQDYKVIGSVRNEAKAKKLMESFKNSNLTTVIVPDISVIDAFDAVFQKYGKDIKYVIHTATPVAFESEDYTTAIINPMVTAAEGILYSIKKFAADYVSRFVYTSSIGAMRPDFDNAFNESAWNRVEINDIVNPLMAYCYAKKIAEQKIWKFQEENINTIKFSVTTINPSIILGPQKFENDVKPVLNFSNQLINNIIHAKPDADSTINPFSDSFINVRDIATAHIQAIQMDALANERLILAGKTYSDQDVLDILNRGFPNLRGKIPVGTPGSGNLSLNDGANNIDDKHSRNLLKINYTPFRETVHSIADQVLKYEYSKK